MTEQSELFFKATIEPRKEFQMLLGTETLFRTEEFVVKTPDDFTIGALFIGSERLIDKVPAFMFSEDAVPEARQLRGVVAHPWPATSITLMIVNDSDVEREFEAVLKGRVQV